jgi:protoporphyrinogen oxidase
MEEVDTLIVGAGITGLAYAAFSPHGDYLVLEALDEVGGYCRTVKKAGFVWDFSGHFFHFRHPEIERYLVSRMPPGEVSTIVKNAQVLFGDRLIDFPFQKNIHQLPKDEFIDCLYDLYFREQRDYDNFRDMLYAKFGRGICERFLIPYNEKLYACDLAELDVNAMGRFFPYADVDEIIRNFKRPDNRSYNATFTYPRGGAIEYIKALQAGVAPERICLGERLEAVDVDHRVAHTSRRRITYRKLVSSAPFPQLLAMTGLSYDPALFSYNKVLVFNLGFDRKGWDGIHWVYVPERRYCFYRVGFYDNIFGSDRMSLYIEIGLRANAEVDAERYRARVLSDLRDAGIVDGHELVAHHHVVLDPAYVHVRGDTQEATEELMAELGRSGVYSIGRYGGWKYCAIEDNIVEARALIEQLEGEVLPLK